MQNGRNKIVVEARRRSACSEACSDACGGPVRSVPPRLRSCEKQESLGDTTQALEIRRLGRWACPRSRSNAPQSRLENSRSGFRKCATLHAYTEICGPNCEFNLDWHAILSGGKPAFPTCEFPPRGWYRRAIIILHSFMHSSP